MTCLTASDKLAVEEGCTLEEDSPNKVKQFIERFCRQSIGQFYKQPLTLLPWQWDNFIRPVWGWKRPSGERRFTQAALWLPKNNGKSSLLSAIALHELLCGPPGAYVVLVANTIEQAGIVYTSAKNMAEFMLEDSPSLDGKLWPRPNIKQIEYKPNKSVLKVMSGEGGKAKAGFPISLLIFDEIADFSDPLLYDHLSYNTKKRKGSLSISISTAGFSQTSIGRERWEYTKAILDSTKTDTSFYPLVYEAPADDPWDDIETAKKCNPSWGVTVFPELVQQELQEAKNNARMESSYKVLRLNQWQHSTQAWLSAATWSACGGPLPDLAGRRCFCGLDLARRHDTASYVLLFPIEDTLYLLPRFFIPAKDAQQKEERDKVPWRAWERQGFVTMTPGDIIDYGYIRKAINEDAKRYNIIEIGYDPWNANLLAQQLQDEDGLNVVEVKQSILHMGPSTARFENLLRDKKIRHPNHPILTAQASVVVVRKDANDNIMPDKLHSQAHIDGITAAIIALNRQMSYQEQTGDWLLFV